MVYRCVGFAVALGLVAGCGSSDPAGAESSTEGSSSSDGSTGVGPGMTSSLPPGLDSTSDGGSSGLPPIDDTTSTTATTDDDGASESSSTGVPDTTGELPPFDPMCDEDPTTGGSSSSDGGGSTTGGDPGGLPNGSACNENGECASGQCYLAGILGGICGECNEDADCDGGGCTTPNPIDGTPSQCNAGEQGAGCETSDVCCGIGICNPVVDIPGIITASTCGQCASNADCPGNAPCQPDYDLTNFAGIWECVAGGSLPDGHGCTLDGDGDSACASGHCAVADVMGIFQLGVCSECEVDGDCNAGETCNPPEVDLAAGLIPGTCQ